MNYITKYVKWLFKKLQEWEGIWLLPSLFIFVLWLSSLLVDIWGPTVGIFPPGYINGIAQAALIFFSGTTVVNFTLYMYHRGWYRYYYGKKHKYENNGEIKYHSKNDVNRISPWLRLIFVPVLQLLLLVLFFSLVAVFI
jgi:hypothetical protein